jgi:hypothetical protein
MTKMPRRTGPLSNDLLRAVTGGLKFAPEYTRVTKASGEPEGENPPTTSSGS